MSGVASGPVRAVHTAVWGRGASKSEVRTFLTATPAFSGASSSENAAAGQDDEAIRREFIFQHSYVPGDVSGTLRADRSALRSRGASKLQMRTFLTTTPAFSAASSSENAAPGRDDEVIHPELFFSALILARESVWDTQSKF